MTTQSNRIVTRPDYTPPTLYPAPARGRNVVIRPLTQMERERRERAAEEAAKTARNALRSRNRQLKKWKKAPLKNQEAANFHDRVYFERLNELLGS